MVSCLKKKYLILSRRVEGGTYGKTIICKNCGFVTMWPKPNFNDYKEINTQWYKVKFSIEPPGMNNKNIFERWEIMRYFKRGIFKKEKWNYTD